MRLNVMSCKSQDNDTVIHDYFSIQMFKSEIVLIYVMEFCMCV